MKTRLVQVKVQRVLSSLSFKSVFQVILHVLLMFEDILNLEGEQLNYYLEVYHVAFWKGQG